MQDDNIIDYKDTFRMLKRYSFESKMLVCNEQSRKIFDVDGNIHAERLIGKVYPWELETFLKMSIMATPEYQHRTFEGKQQNVFSKMINGIRRYIHPCLKKMSRTDFTAYFMAGAGVVQFQFQEEVLYSMYRYNYIYNFLNDRINMQERFESFFGAPYSDYLLFGRFMSLLQNHVLKSFDGIGPIIGYLSQEKYPVVCQKLTIDVCGYKQELNKLGATPDDIMVCLCPSYKFPFIRNDEYIYFPLPHVMIRSVTSSLLFRLTEEDCHLRDKVGKDVLEKYLYDLLLESEVYDEIYGEKEFEIEHHNKVRTVDVMVRKKEEYLFIDSKASVPTNGLRIFDEKSFKREADHLVDNIVQLYKQIKVMFFRYNSSYNQFIGKPNIDVAHIWGIVARLEDNHIMREPIYLQAAKKLMIDEGSDEYEWLINHIKVTDFISIERYAFTGRSLFEGIKKQQEMGKPTDFAFSCYEAEEVRYKHKKLIQFKEKINDDVLKLTAELKEKGLLQ